MSSIFQAVAALDVCFEIVCVCTGVVDGTTVGVTGVVGAVAVCCVFAANINIKVVAKVSAWVTGRIINAPFWGLVFRPRNCTHAVLMNEKYF